jgi:hypothetical protein
MAGRKQHYIPQFFQRGFCITGKGNQTNVYRRENHYTLNINSVGAQRDFYSSPSSSGEETLDDSITFYENRLGSLVHSLRTLKIGDSADPKAAAAIIAHLIPRTNSARNIIKHSTRLFINEASDLFSDKEELIFNFGFDQVSTNPTWSETLLPLIEKEEIFKELTRQFNEAANIPKEFFNILLFILSKESILSDNNPLPNIITLLPKILANRIDKSVDDGQKKILKEDLTIKSRIRILEKYKWYIDAGPAEGAIMPDCIAIGLDETDNKFYPHIMTFKAPAVVMPLTPQKLLIGISNDFTPFNLLDFNKEASECCDDFFISSQSSHNNLQKNIGNRWKNKIELSISDTIDKIRAPEKPKTSDPYYTTPSNYDLIFTENTSEFNILIIKGKINKIIERTKHLAVSRLDKIIFTSDIQKTIINTERGFNTKLIPEETPDFIVQGAAIILVQRNKKLKIHLIIDNSYALNIIQRPKSSTCISSHIFAAGFSFSNIIDKFEKKLPGFLMEPVPIQNHDSTLHAAVRKALRAYKYAYDSSEFGSKRIFEKEFSNYLAKTLDFNYYLIDEAKKRHSVNQDFHTLFITIHNAITGILIDSAKFIGHMEGIGEDPIKKNTEIMNKLNTLNLTGWFKVFAYDLHNFWQKADWIREDLHAFNIHVERLLYPKGILIYNAGKENGTMIFSSTEN